MIDFRNKLVKEGFKQDEIRPEIKRRMFQLKENSLNLANEKLLSFAFVRDPFERLASCYYNKMVMSNWHRVKQDLRWMRDEILVKFRPEIDPSTSNENPSPVEFARYIVEQSQTFGAEHLDNHIRPMWSSCPFCKVDFDVIGHLEDFDSDAGFIIDNLKLNISQVGHKNSGSNHNSKLDFFKAIPSDLRLELFQVYKMDFEMFAYPWPDFILLE